MKWMPGFAVIIVALFLVWISRHEWRGEHRDAPEPSTAVTGAPEHARPSVLPSPAPSPIATLIEPFTDVQIRRAQELIWKEGADRAPLANRDAVKTGKSSGAIIRFNDRSELKVSEQSMVIVAENRKIPGKGDQSKVNLPSGKVGGRLKRQGDHDVEMEVRTARGWIYATTRGKKGSPGTEPIFQVEMSPKGRLEVKSEEGDLMIWTKDRKQMIHPHEVFLVKEPSTPPTEVDYETLPDVPDADMKLSHEQPESAQKARPKAPTKRPRPLPGNEEAAQEDSSNDTNLGPPKVFKAKEVDAFRILSPPDRSETDSENVTIEGRLTGRLKAYLNGDEIHAKPDGGFSTPVHLASGKNILNFEVKGPGKDDVHYESLELTRK